MNTAQYTVCETVRDIVCYGYSDNDALSTEEHQQLCNCVDNVLPVGWYWLGSAQACETIGDCDISGEAGFLWTVTAAERSA